MAWCYHSLSFHSFEPKDVAWAEASVATALPNADRATFEAAVMVLLESGLNGEAPSENECLAA